MAPQRSDGSKLNFGVICLPVMSCVLAAILFSSSREKKPVSVSADDRNRLAELEPAVAGVSNRLAVVKSQVEQVVTALNEKKRLEELIVKAGAEIDRLKKEHVTLSKRMADNKGRLSLVEKMEALRAELEAISKIEIELARLRKEQALLSKTVTEAQERSALLKKIEAARAEIGMLSNVVSQVASKRKSIENRLNLAGMDEFPRPYVVIECRKSDAKVYVPKQPVKTLSVPTAEDMMLAAQDLEWLRKEIVAVRAVVVFARVASFEDSYWKVYRAVLTIQDDEEKMNRNVAVSFVPIQEREDVTGHVLLGGGE